MNKFIKILITGLAFSGCTPPPIIEGEIISTREIDHVTLEHLIKTDSFQIPYYVLRTTKGSLKKGERITIDMQVNSRDQIAY
ncbi:MAG: hypothetical protein K2Y18_06265 [Alphaproteobacteria bacterium]|nr:hypothetical protein [Alphaproteobacteria bacterium]